MARTIAEIKKEIADQYVSYDEVIQAYQLEENGTFDAQFSKVSLENIIFYVIAFVCWTLETLFDTHKEECLQLIDEKKPHRLKWYRDKALAFQCGKALITDSDTYDNTGLSEEEVEATKIVKYAAVVEKGGTLFIKIAGEGEDGRDPIEEQDKVALEEYFKEIKDAGVRFEIINLNPDAFSCEFDIYYDPMILSNSGARLDGNGDSTVQDAIKNYIINLPFNGEYSNAALVDVLQKIDGVVIPELLDSKFKYGTREFESINAKYNPDAGYMRIYNEEEDLKINWKAYQTIE